MIACPLEFISLGEPSLLKDWSILVPPGARSNINNNFQTNSFGPLIQPLGRREITEGVPHHNSAQGSLPEPCPWISHRLVSWGLGKDGWELWKSSHLGPVTHLTFLRERNRADRSKL